MDKMIYLLAVESDGRGRVDVLAELESVEDGGLAGRVEADHGAVVGAQQGQQRLLAQAGAHLEIGEIENFVVAKSHITTMEIFNGFQSDKS